MDNHRDSVEILGVRVDRVNQLQALKKVVEWMGSQQKHYIVTPNLEFILFALERVLAIIPGLP